MRIFQGNIIDDIQCFNGRSSLREAFLGKRMALRHNCSPINLLHIFRTPFYNNTYRRLILHILYKGRLPTVIQTQAEIKSPNLAQAVALLV